MATPGMTSLLLALAALLPLASATYVWDQNTPVRLMHSHNDENRDHPLWDALTYGCMSIEADVHLSGDGKTLLVGHDDDSLNPNNTLPSMYLDPILTILKANGSIYQSSPDTPMMILIDFKNGTDLTLAALEDELTDLRDAGYLTTSDGETLTPGKLTVIATGDYPWELVEQTTGRDVFVDAPLASLNDSYTNLNSGIASADLFDATGWVWLLTTDEALQKIEDQISAAHAKGLRARYWDNPQDLEDERDDCWDDVLNPIPGGESGQGRDLINTDHLTDGAEYLDALS